MRRAISQRAVAATLAATAFLAIAADVAADVTKAQCVEMDTSAQNERRAGHLRAARDLLQTCSKPACPKLVRDDCTQRLNDVESQLPTVTFSAKDARGDDVVAVRVTMDGAPFAAELSGVALAADPGVHAFKFEAEGAACVEKQVVLHEGERGRQEKITFADLHAPAAPARESTAAVVTPAAEPSSSWSGQKTVAVALGGVGVVGLVVGVATGAMSFSAWSSSKNECGAGACTNHAQSVSDHDGAVRDATISDIGFIAGGLLAATGVVLFLTAPSASPRTGMDLRIVPGVGRGGGGLGLEGRF